MSKAPLTKARTFPSGEYAEVESPRNPAVGVVSRRVSRVSTESKKMQLGSPSAGWLENARYFPSGDQERALPYSYIEKNPVVPEYNFRSGPPKAGTMKMLI